MDYETMARDKSSSNASGGVLQVFDDDFKRWLGLEVGIEWQRADG